MKNTVQKLLSLAAAFAVTVAVSSAASAEDGDANELRAIDAYSIDVSVTADIQETYIVTIPTTVRFGVEKTPGEPLRLTAEGIVKASDVFVLNNGRIDVKISESSEFKLTNATQSETLTYSIKNEDGGECYESGSAVLSVQSEETGTNTLIFTIDKNPTAIDDYVGTLIFEVEIVKDSV